MYVVIDTPSGLDESTLAALEYTTDVVLLSATDVPSVRSTRKEIDALRIIGRPEQQWHFVLNRADARTGLTIGAIEQAVGVSVDVAIPSSRSVPVSLNKGVPIIEADPRAPVALAISQLVHRFVPPASDGTSKPAKRKVKAGR
jgi:pilus assembly protein CpaE